MSGELRQRKGGAVDASLLDEPGEHRTQPDSPASPRGSATSTKFISTVLIMIGACLYILLVITVGKDISLPDYFDPETREKLTNVFGFVVRNWHLLFLILLTGFALLWFFCFTCVWQKQQVLKGLQGVGVITTRIKRTVLEFERKTFHLCGLMVPLGYNLLLRWGLTEKQCLIFAATLTGGWWTAELARLNIPIVKRNFPLRSIFREDEQNKLTGTSYFSLGSTLAIALFPPKIAICTHLWLVLGDLSAAIIGISFGKIKIVGSKSLEGSTAMFIVCCSVGFNIFWHVHMREYAIFVGALVATLVELFEPFGINDNLSIPLCSGFALKWGLNRLATCQRDPTSIMWFAENIPINSISG